MACATAEIAFFFFKQRRVIKFKTPFYVYTSGPYHRSLPYALWCANTRDNQLTPHCLPPVISS